MEEEDNDNNNNNNNNRVRIFVGGLGEAVTPEDLRRLFGSLGSVEGVDTIASKRRSFAYVDFVPSPTDHKSLSKLFSKYNGCLWKSGKLRLEKAKEHYLVRLKREWKEDAEFVSTQPDTDLGCDNGVSLKEMPNRDSSKTKQLHIFFPRLKKVKPIPFNGTGKHKYSFRNVEVPPLPVHFCDCEEHCSPSDTVKGKQSYDGAAESGGMNDEEINIMNTVMNKLFEKEKVSNTMHRDKEQDSFESPDGLHSNECETDSATDEDDLIINMETKKNIAALKGSQELLRILENQESWLNKSRISKDEPNMSMLEAHKRKNRNPNKKRKSLPNSERESNKCVSLTPGGKSYVQTHPDELGSGVQPTELEDGFGESTRVPWSQKSSWRELLGEGGNTAFSASLILPKFDSCKDQERSDGPSTTLYADKKTDHMERDGYLGSKPTNAELTKELAEVHPTNSGGIEELADEDHPTDKNVAPKKMGRGASWLQKQSWTQLVGENNSSFCISQILPGVTFPEPMAKEPIGDPVNSSDFKHNGVAKLTTNEVVSDGLNYEKIIPEKSQHVGASDNASAPISEKKMKTIQREISSEKTIPRERSTAEVKISETCSFMRSAASLREWEKAKASLTASLKRKRSEK